MTVRVVSKQVDSSTNLESSNARVPAASAQLLAAAISGILCLAGCGDDPHGSKAGSVGGGDGEGRDSTGDAGAARDGGEGGGNVDGKGDGGSRDAGDGDGNLTSDAGSDNGDGDAAIGDGGNDADPHSVREITLTKNDPTMTSEKFNAACADAKGHVEVHSHCGGLNTCRGFSFDTGTLVYTEHTCMGLNTCAGYSCVVPDEG